MKSIYTFKDYRSFLKAAFEARSKNGFGEAKRLAEYLSVHPTFISQVLKDVKFFNSEQALAVAEYLNLNELETEYFILLVQIERAGTTAYKQRLKKKLQELDQKANDLVHRVRHEARLNPEEQATFYSDWIYSAFRLSTLLPKMNSLESLSKHLGVPIPELKMIADFLVQAGLVKLEKSLYKIGPLSTHLERSSPWIKSHHLNWRQKAIERMNLKKEESLYYTAPMTVSRKDMEVIKEVLIKAINDIDKIVEPSESETLVCLNMDWFEVNPQNS